MIRIFNAETGKEMQHDPEAIALKRSLPSVEKLLNWHQQVSYKVLFSRLGICVDLNKVLEKCLIST